MFNRGFFLNFSQEDGVQFKQGWEQKGELKKPTQRGGWSTVGAVKKKTAREMWLQSKSSEEQTWEGGKKMEGWDDGCVALILCPLTKTLMSVCVIPLCLLCLLILINYIHLALSSSIPFFHPPSFCPPKITYLLSEPHLDQTCFYLLAASLCPPLCHPLFLPPFSASFPFAVVGCLIFVSPTPSCSLFLSHVLGRCKSPPTSASLWSYLLWQTD